MIISPRDKNVSIFKLLEEKNTFNRFYFVKE